MDMLPGMKGGKGTRSNMQLDAQSNQMDAASGIYANNGMQNSRSP